MKRIAEKSSGHRVEMREEGGKIAQQLQSPILEVFSLKLWGANYSLYKRSFIPNAFITTQERVWPLEIH